MEKVLRFRREFRKGLVVEENYSYWLTEQFKKKFSLPSDRQVALRIENLTEGSLGQIKKGTRNLTPEQAMYIAEQCGLDIGETLVRLDMEKSKSPAVKAELAKVLKRLAGVFAGLALMASLAMGPSPSEASASA